jgi:hypothetical protein
MKPRVLSLFDFTGHMVAPWLEAGYPCTIVDTQHEPGERTEGLLTTVGADVTTYLPPRGEYAFACAFPPCTDLAVSGAQYFQDKGLAALAGSLALVERARRVLEWTGAPWCLENPVGMLSTYWRTPDFTFHPYEFGGYLDPESDAYEKKTCLWTGGGFVLPWTRPVTPVRVSSQGSWLMALGGKSARTKQLRSATPRGFARAVFQFNQPAAAVAAAAKAETERATA